MRRWCPAVCISSCLSLISILRGNLVGLCRLNRCVSLGGKVVCFHSLFFGMGAAWVLQYGTCPVSGSEVDITMQFLPTGWSAHSLKDRPSSAHSLSFCFTFASPTLSTHSCITSCTIVFFFAFFLTNHLKFEKKKQRQNILQPSNIFLKRSRQMVVNFIF